MQVGLELSRAPVGNARALVPFPTAGLTRQLYLPHAALVNRFSISAAGVETIKFQFEHRSPRVSTRKVHGGSRQSPNASRQSPANNIPRDKTSLLRRRRTPLKIPCPS